MTPYKDVTDLPESVQKNLPKHAQKIYMEAFNNAWEEYAKPKDRRGDASREETGNGRRNSDFRSIKNAESDWLCYIIFILAIVATVVGARGIAGTSMEIAKWLIIAFIVLAVLSALLSFR